MNMRPAITFGIGVVLASAAVFLASQQLDRSDVQRGPAAAEPPFKIANILVATNDLKFGNRIGQEHIKAALWPADSIPEGAFTDPEQLLGDGTEDRVVLKPMMKGEPILASKVSGFGGRASMSTLIPEGKRAYAIRVNAVTGVAGFLLPGDRVDILLTRKVGSNANHKVTDVILQNIAVRGVDQISDEDRNKPQVARTVTVEVTPDEAQKLALAMQVGTLTLALRNMQSGDLTRSRTIGIADLQGHRHSDDPPSPSVRVRRGADVTVVRVRGD